jgi:hypothetical protein
MDHHKSEISHFYFTAKDDCQEILAQKYLVHPDINDLRDIKRDPDLCAIRSAAAARGTKRGMIRERKNLDIDLSL